MKSLCLFCALFLSLASPLRAEPTEVVFGIISTEASSALKQQWQPLLDDLESRTGLKVKPFFASDYAGIIEAMRFGKVQFAYFGNKSAMEAVDRADGQVFAQTIQANGLGGYYSLLITQKDSDIHDLADLLNRPGKYSFANGDPNSTSGYLVPGYYVFTLNHIDPKTHFKRVVTGSHETNIMAVLNKQVDVATNNTNDMEKVGRELGDRIKDIRIIWTSPLIPADPIVWRKDLASDTKAKLAKFFYEYGRIGSAEQQQRDKDILKVLTFSGFHQSSDQQLIPVRQWELFKTRGRTEADETLSPAEKAARLAEIDAKLAELNKNAGSSQ
jgi:phosphonate transport system substrate-binding protein